MDTGRFEGENLIIEVSNSDQDGQAIIALNGELDPHTSPGFSAVYDQILADEAVTSIIIDIERLGFVDSSGMRTIIHSHAASEDSQKELALRNPSPTVARLLEITGLVDHITVINEQEGA